MVMMLEHNEEAVCSEIVSKAASETSLNNRTKSENRTNPWESDRKRQRDIKDTDQRQRYITDRQTPKATDQMQTP